jgi:hypothetical protein
MFRLPRNIRTTNSDRPVEGTASHQPNGSDSREGTSRPNSPSFGLWNGMSRRRLISDITTTLQTQRH